MKLALITGASSGIGEAAARQLTADGYKVILVARGRIQLEKIAGEIGQNAVAESCNASDGDQVLAMAARVRRDHGVPEVIVHCAGAGQWKSIEDTTSNEAAMMMRAPFFAAMNVTAAFMRDMLDQKRGVIIHVNSPASICPWPSSTGYAAARWALRGLHEALCQDLHGTGVHSCQVVFGRVSGGYFAHNSVGPEKVPSISKIVRTISPSECGKVISRIAQRPRRQTYHPPMLQALVLVHAILPGLTRLLLRRTPSRRV